MQVHASFCMTKAKNSHIYTDRNTLHAEINPTVPSEDRFLKCVQYILQYKKILFIRSIEKVRVPERSTHRTR